MRRFSLLVPLVVVMLLAAVTLAGQRPAVAQDATPSAEDEFVLEGVTFEPIGFGTAEVLPTAPADLSLVRLTVEPGAALPSDEADPAVALVVVESGVLTVNVDAPMRVTRAATIAAFATPGVDESAVPAPEEMAAGTEFTLEAGDSMVFPPHVGGELRNDGEEPAVVLAALIEPLEQEAGTPAP